LCGPSAVDRDRLAGDIARERADQVVDSGGDFLEGDEGLLGIGVSITRSITSSSEMPRERA